MKKTIRVVVIVTICVVAVAVLTVWGLYGARLSAALGVEKLADGLYSMRYAGDYGLDEFLEQGGAASDAEVAEFTARFLGSANLVSKRDDTAADRKFACSTICVASPDGGQLMGRNYDWQRCDAMIVHAKPKNGYESLSTCCLDFLGFGKSWKPEGIQNQYMSLVALYVPLDGMNEAGLCVADLICGDNIQIKQDTDKPDLTVTTAIRLLLDRAASVDEAVALLENYDMNSSIGMSHHLAISDSSGRSVVVEYVDGQMIVTDTPVVTNHYLSAGSKFGVGNNLSHARYNKLMSLRDKFHGIMPADEVKLALRSVSYPNITQWSIVYDMEHLSMDFYWQRQFESSYGFSLVRQ